MACCDDPTEPKKLDRRELIRIQEHYGELLRDLVTEDPEKVILNLLNHTNTYLTELAALQAYHASVRLRAIASLDKPSIAVLQHIAEKDAHGEFGSAAKARLAQIYD